MRTPQPNGEIQRGLAQVKEFSAAARSLGSDMAAYAELLAHDSRAALQEIESLVLGTPMEEDWPLAGKHTLLSVVSGKARTQLQGGAMESPPPQSDRDTIVSIMSYKYSDDKLSGIYKNEEPGPRTGFTNDLVRWSTAISRKGWPIIADLDVRGEHSVEVAIYEDGGGMREVIDERSSSGERQPYRWLSSEVVATGSLEELQWISQDVPA